MCSSEMETDLGKEIAAFSMSESAECCDHSRLSFSASVGALESPVVTFPTSSSSSSPQLVPASLVVGLPQHFPYSDLQLVVNSNATPALARVLSRNSGDEEEEEKKREREREKERERELHHLHKKRSKNWTRVETLQLIKMRTDMDSRFARSGRKSELWDEIAGFLQKGHFARDAQQCRDKWEKLMASYKDVRDGFKDKEDNPYYDELHLLLSGKSMRKEKDMDNKDFVHRKESDHSDQITVAVENREMEGNLSIPNSLYDDEEDMTDMYCSSRKRKRSAKYVSAADVNAVKALLETVISQQQRFFKELLDSIERSEQAREQVRQEREENWRAEERAHRNILNNAMIVLTRKLVGDRGTSLASSAISCIPASSEKHFQVPKKRSKNWKRGEVLQLIKLRGEMEGRFANSTRRAVLWEELAEVLGMQGIKRDAKQCREKWDKLMATYKDVIDGKREEGDLPYFNELKTIVGGKTDDGFRFHTESDEFK